jgi:hypothetical protein
LQRRKIFEFAPSTLVLCLALAAYETLKSPRSQNLPAHFFRHLLWLGVGAASFAVIHWFGKRWKFWGLLMVSFLCAASAAIMLTLLLLHKVLMGLLAFLYVLLFLALATDEFRKLRAPQPRAN